MNRLERIGAATLAVLLLAGIILLVATRDAHASRRASKVEAARIYTAVRGTLGAKGAACTRPASRIRVGTAAPSYALYEWSSRSHTICAQGSGLILKRAGARWRVLNIYTPDAMCGDYMELAFIDLLGGCYATSDHMPKAPGTIAECGQVDLDDVTYTIRLTRDLPLSAEGAPGKITCSQAVQLWTDGYSGRFDADPSSQRWVYADQTLASWHGRIVVHATRDTTGIDPPANYDECIAANASPERCAAMFPPADPVTAA